MFDIHTSFQPKFDSIRDKRALLLDTILNSEECKHMNYMYLLL